MTERKEKARYAELHAASAFSFLDGATLPEDLVARAAELELAAVALVDRNGLSGAPRFHRAARASGIKPIVGAEVSIEEMPSARVTLLVENQAGYRNLCRLLTGAARGKPKGRAAASWQSIETFAAGLHCLTGGAEGPLRAILKEDGIEAADRLLDRLSGFFGRRLHVELQRHRDRGEEHENAALIDLVSRRGIPLLATNGARYARSGEKDLHDVLTCIAHHTTIDRAGRLLSATRERCLKSAGEMASLFADRPDALRHAAELSGELSFTLANLGYRFPDFPVPPGETQMSHLRRLTREEAPGRFRPFTAAARMQLEKELAVIERLDLAGYFLIVRDIVRFCREENILVQGRGSAANSAVCYALAITAVDPVKMDLLFERFLSEERGEWPDIDLDLPSGDQREKVIQHVFKKYGRDGAAMTANVITYRGRSAAREAAKALGFLPEHVDRLSRALSGRGYGEDFDPEREVEAGLKEAGFDPGEERTAIFLRVWRAMQNLPRHLGQHSGGMVIAAGRLDEVVPLEPAAMEGRTIVQWDKDDCADLGIIKVDLLGLGMLSAMEQAIPMIRRHEGVEVDLARLPQDDPAIYRMLGAADTVGVFQVESRAQMATLPRHAPKCFYDIVVQVAIIRPGPIQGGMIRPFFDRHANRALVEYPHPSLEPILRRTLGVPLFQEQLLRIAMVAAGFTGGEAEELRRAMGFKRSVERMESIERRLRTGMIARGITGAAQDQIVRSITSFALYGFPESHAASFALIAYASAYLKSHHPAAFYASLLNAWPMGFYSPATLVQDAMRHGIVVHPIDVRQSGWLCRWESGGVRLGLRFVDGLSSGAGERIAREASGAPFADMADLSDRCRPTSRELAKLAHAGALASFGLTRRAALWQAARLAHRSGPLDRPADGDRSPLPEMIPLEETLSDYATTGITTGAHLFFHWRGELTARGIVCARDLARAAEGARVRAAGAVIVRQRPGTAKGFVFLTLEDETGTIQAIVRPQLFRRAREVIVGSSCLMVEGRLQKSEGTLSVRAERIEPLAMSSRVASHDFR